MAGLLNCRVRVAGRDSCRQQAPQSVGFFLKRFVETHVGHAAIVADDTCFDKATFRRRYWFREYNKMLIASWIASRRT